MKGEVDILGSLQELDTVFTEIDFGLGLFIW